MKKTLLIVITVLSLVFSNTAYSQIAVNSSNGYSVNIVIMPTTIVPTGNSCQWGYNYNVRFNYSVIFLGNNKPSSLYTLQGTIGCGSSSHFFDIPNTQGSGTATSQSNVWRSISDCSTANVTSLLCNNITIQIAGPGIPNQYISFNISNNPLPVKLAQFTADGLQGKVKLYWETASEMNSDHFTIERSLNGTDWNPIKTVNAAGNSSTLLNYTVYDENPATGTILYRIMMTSKDGNIEYSSTRSVLYKDIAAISVYPVPNKGNNINLTGIKDPINTMIKIVDMSGVTIYQARLTGLNVELPQLKTGAYIISLTDVITAGITNLRYMKI